MAVAGYPQPIITTVSPNSGPVAGGTTVTISGSYFDTLINVSVDGQTVPTTSFSANQIILNMPAHTAGPVSFIVYTSGGSVTLSQAFTYLEPVVVIPDVCDKDKKNKKVAICHLPPGNPANTQQLCLPESAIPAHLAHGDYLGTCK